jgi:hypothetical protein
MLRRRVAHGTKASKFSNRFGEKKIRTIRHRSAAQTLAKHSELRLEGLRRGELFTGGVHCYKFLNYLTSITSAQKVYIYICIATWRVHEKYI